VCNAAQEACVVSNTSYGSCQPYPSDGICARFFPNNAPVYIPQGTYQSDIEKSVINYIQTANSEAMVLGSACLQMANEFTCLTHYLPCINGTSPNQSLPILPCATFCVQYWTTCADVQKLNFQEGLKGDYAASPIPNCLLGGTYDGSYANPQLADVWGGRKIGGWLPTINGLLGEVLMPIDAYNYTYTNGTTVQLECYTPNVTSLSTAIYSPPPITCQAPLTLDDSGTTCVLNCPFPVFGSDTQFNIQAAYVAPAILGFALCLFVLADALILIHAVYSHKWRHFLSKSGWNSSTKDSDSPTRSGESGPRRFIHKSTLYALVGALLGCIYFFIGPLATIMYGSTVSCESPTINLLADTTGNAAPDSISCRAQRASPFVLQALFNLILYSIVGFFNPNLELYFPTLLTVLRRPKCFSRLMNAISACLKGLRRCWSPFSASIALVYPS